MLVLVELVDVAPTDDVAEWLIDSPLKFAFKGKFHFILMEDGWSTSQREENFDGLREKWKGIAFCVAGGQIKG